MFYFLLALLFIVGLMYYLNGNTDITKEVRASWAPDDIEALQEEYNNNIYIGQCILVIFSIILMFLIT